MVKYDSDFYKWTLEQSELLRNHEYEKLDVDNLIEEIESLGRSDKRALESQMVRIMTHLLKMNAQPENNHIGWKNTIREARKRLRSILKDSPSLKSYVTNDVLCECYKDAIEWAADETGINETEFPEKCEWTLEEIMGEKTVTS